MEPNIQTSELAAALAAMRGGGAIILLDDKRELEADIAFAGKFASNQLVNLCLNRARGLLCVAMWPRDAERLGISRLPTNHRDVFDTPFGVPIGLANGTTGISAPARAATIRAVAEGAAATEFCYPGHVATLLANPLGLRGRTGHTEAILDLLRIGEIDGPGVLCEILDDSGDIATLSFLQQLSEQHGLPILRLEDVRLAVASKGHAR
jgi:3,4-dihydroxy 2-butanone 4-phosphate synthase